jgi:hypothetical protein
MSCDIAQWNAIKDIGIGIGIALVIAALKWDGRFR